MKNLKPAANVTVAAGWCIETKRNMRIRISKIQRFIHPRRLAIDSVDPSIIFGRFAQGASDLQSELAEVCDASVKACLCSHQQQTTNRVFKVGRFTKCGCDSYAGGDQQQGSLFDRNVPERDLARSLGHVRAPRAATVAKRDGRCSARFGPDRVFAAIVVLQWNGGGQGGRGVSAPRSSASYRHTPDA